MHLHSHSWASYLHCNGPSSWAELRHLSTSRQFILVSACIKYLGEIQVFWAYCRVVRSSTTSNSFQEKIDFRVQVYRKQRRRE